MDPVAYDIMNLVSNEPATDVQTCLHCGFSWATLTRAEIATRMSEAIETFVKVIQKAGANVAKRPSEEQWSILEYGGHLRDVILSVRERIVLASILDVPWERQSFAMSESISGFTDKTRRPTSRWNCR